MNAACDDFRYRRRSYGQITQPLVTFLRFDRWFDRQRCLAYKRHGKAPEQYRANKCPMTRLVLGINSAHGDSAAALVGESGIIAAIAEERINRKKHFGGFPALAIREVLRIASASISDVTDIAVARNPVANLAAKFRFVAQHPISVIPRIEQRLRVHRAVAGTAETMANALGCPAQSVSAKLHRVEHHLAHVASAFYWSPFETATGLSIDGAGDFASSMMAACDGLKIRILGRTQWPHSLGVFYTAICQFLGFERFGEEYKVMGLSAYGKSRFLPEVARLVEFDSRKGFRLNLRYFQHHLTREPFESMQNGEVHVPRLYSEELANLFGPPRSRTAEITDRDRDLAASMQAHFEQVYLSAVKAAVLQTGCRSIAMAGGCALNSVANGRMLSEQFVDRAYFHPAASDDGTAAGSALHVLHAVHGVRRSDPVSHAYWGTSWTDQEIEKSIACSSLPFLKLERSEVISKSASALAQGKIIGWFHGREEWGPRALGNRSILCHPGWPDMKATLNARIKNREPFRPFAPVILKERLSDCFEGDHEVPFMIAVYKVRPEWRERLSAITHEDGTGRVQTINRGDNPIYYDLIEAFHRTTGIPVLLNTSFNENEPIVHTPEEAIACFERTRMDALAIGSFWAEKPPNA